MKSLIIVDIDNPYKYGIEHHFALAAKHKDPNISDYHAVIYCDDPDNNIITKLNHSFSSKINVIDFTKVLEKKSGELRKNVNEFVYQIGENLGAIAEKVLYKHRAENFRKLWWYTELSHKNSPVDPTWWTLLRFKISQHYLEKFEFKNIIYIGEKFQEDLVRQYCSKSALNFTSYTLAGKHYLWRFILLRILSGLCYLTAAILTKIKYSNSNINTLKSKNKKTVLGYSWFPTAWSQRYGKYQDHYYGNSLELLKNNKKLNFIPIYRIYTDNEYIFPNHYWKRLKKTKTDLKLKNGCNILEYHSHFFEIISNYFKLNDIIDFFKISKSEDFRRSFHFDGIDTTDLFLPRLWRSISLWVPHLICLENSAERLTKKLNPELGLLYCYEFSYGRAIINGTKKNTDVKVIGIQHGPITQMKFLYSGDSRELQKNRKYLNVIPTPDLYVLDGEIARDILKERGITDINLNILGPMRLDTIWEKAKDSTEIDRFISKETRILVAPGHIDSDVVIRLILNAAKNSDYRFTIKIHPKVSMKLINKIIREDDNAKSLDSCVRVISHGDIYSHMKNHDIFLSSYSSAGVEAIAFGLPVIILRSKRTPDMSLFRSFSDKIMYADNYICLNENIKILTSDKVFRNKYLDFLNRVFYVSFGKLDSNASKILEIFVKNIINKKATIYNESTMNNGERKKVYSLSGL